ncbi:MAG: FtsB family cell division protein [Marmoricola sp.]
MARGAPRPTGKSASKSTRTSARRPAASRTGARRPAAKPIAKAAPPAERGSRATNRLVILLLVIGALVISFGSSLRAYLRQSDQIHQLQAQIAASQASIAASKEQQKRLRDPSYIEQQARLRFGWVMPGQTPYVVLGPDGQPLNSKAELDAQPPTVSTTPTSWWSKEAAAFKTADSPPQVKKPAPAKRITGQ